MGVADERDPLASQREAPGLLHGEERLAAARAATDLDAIKQADGVENDGLMLGERIGRVFVGERPGDNACVAVIPCRSTPFASWPMPAWVSSGRSSLLA